MAESASGSESETESAQIARSLSAARHAFEASSRQSARQALQSNLVKAREAAKAKAAQNAPTATFSPLSTTKRHKPPVLLNNTMLGSSRTVLAEEMPVVKPNPSYKAWGYLVNNELAQGVGRQMYYTDEIGETIPLSDSDEEMDSDTESLDGVQRQADMFLLSKAVSQYGVDPEAVRIAASMIKAKRSTVQMRMQSLAAAVPQGPSLPLNAQKLDVMVANLATTFCRRCLIFNCFTHTGPHIKPHERRPAKSSAQSSAPCSKQCYKEDTAQSNSSADQGIPHAEPQQAGRAVDTAPSQAMQNQQDVKPLPLQPEAQFAEQPISRERGQTAAKISSAAAESNPVTNDHTAAQPASDVSACQSSRKRKRESLPDAAEAVPSADVGTSLQTGSLPAKAEAALAAAASISQKAKGKRESLPGAAEAAPAAAVGQQAEAKQETGKLIATPQSRTRLSSQADVKHEDCALPIKAARNSKGRKQSTAENLETIVLSDSEEDQPPCNAQLQPRQTPPRPTLKPTQPYLTPRQPNLKPMHPNQTPSRPTLKPFQPKTSPGQLFSGSTASDPFVIVISESDEEEQGKEHVRSPASTRHQSSAHTTPQQFTPGSELVLCLSESSKGQNIPVDGQSAMPIKGQSSVVSKGQKGQSNTPSKQQSQVPLKWQSSAPLKNQTIPVNRQHNSHLKGQSTNFTPCKAAKQQLPPLSPSVEGTPSGSGQATKGSPSPLGSPAVGKAAKGSPSPLGSPAIGSSMPFSPVDSTPMGSTPVGSIPIGSSSSGTTPIGSSLIGNSPLRNRTEGSPVGSTPIGSTPIGSAMGSIPSQLNERVLSAARSRAMLSAPRQSRSSDTISNSTGSPSAGPLNSKDDHPDAGWTAFEVSVFDKAAEMFSGDSCRMACLVGTKTCLEVHARLQKVGLPAALAGAATLTQEPSGPQPRGRWRKASFCKKKMKTGGQAKHVVLKRWKQSKGKLVDEAIPYQPCQCKGACKDGCPCTDAGHFCEKFCACGPECQSRFKGCVCKGGCRTRSCPCIAADRECDADLCKPCQWTVCKDRPAGSVDCHNMKLRLRQHKRVAMGLSHIAGWGAFAQEDIKRNEFVAEYTGELINHKEADRRGKAYDRDSNTYLFDLNADWVIDAKQKGNKMRFANHSDEPNCRVQIKMVDGDHRVAIYAAKDIPTGTELLYNYGNKFGKV